MRDLSISIHFVRAVLRHTVRLGVNPIGLLRKNRISPRLLQESDARISIERFADLQVSTMLAMEDEALGYASRPMPIGTWSMMCHAVISCETLGQALARHCRFFQLFAFDTYPRLLSVDKTTSIELAGTDQQKEPEAYHCETTLFNIHRFGSWLIQEHIPLQSVNLIYPPAAATKDYRHMFRASPMAFEQPASKIVLATSLLDKPVVQNEQSLRHYLRHPVLMMLTQDYVSRSWTTRVTEKVRHNLIDMPELIAVADALEIHPQTLRRRLSAEGITFKEIKNQLRRDTALHLLGKHGLSIEEIAHRSGFSEASAFIRAFKGWTGVTPYTYRKGL
ncbi:MAG: AraC family transcriptional regulator [Halioglobus sp.]